MAYHSLRAQQTAEKVKLCKVIEPDLILLILEETDYILFNRHLRIHHNNAAYRGGFENAITLVSKETMGNYTEMIDMHQKPDIAGCFLK